jgi:hypothetical protein
MLRNTLVERPTAPPASFVCWLVALIELATALTIGIAALTPADAGQKSSGQASVHVGETETSFAEAGPLAASSDDATTVSGVAFSMLGTWEDDYKGHRTLTLRPDGTGTMVVELNGLAATLFAAKLTFTEEWSVTDGKVTMKATGGEPAGKVRLVLSLHGDSSTQRIVEVTDDRMILVEEPSETRFEWRRVRTSDLREATGPS